MCQSFVWLVFSLTLRYVGYPQLHFYPEFHVMTSESKRFIFFTPTLPVSSSRLKPSGPLSRGSQSVTSYRSSPLPIAVGVARLAWSSSPASTDAFAAFCPIGLSLSETNSFSIFSRVVRVSSSTSAAVRWAVGIGGNTIKSHNGNQQSSFPIAVPEAHKYQEGT